jgi:hypothetical protein
MRSLRIITACVAAVGVLVGAVTGFGGELLFDGVGGWMLLVHLAAAPLMMVGMTGVALLWGARHRFDTGPNRPAESLRKTAFWLMLLSALLSIGSMLLAMWPLFGYAGQDQLRVIHELSGIGLLAAGALYLPLALVRRRPA